MLTVFGRWTRVEGLVNFGGFGIAIYLVWRLVALVAGGEGKY